MNRRKFIFTALSSVAAMSTLNSLKSFADWLPVQGMKMPALFIGHGSPMNGIQHNEFTQTWSKLGREIPRPEAVLVISAHWLTKGTHITAMEQPRTIHDFSGFPKELYEVQYPAKGSPELAAATARLITSTHTGMNHDWGLDHGTWTVVKHMYPDAEIPVLQLSIDYHQPAQYHYDLARQLASLRNKGVLIIGSGNMVHNLRLISFGHINVPDYGFAWAREMNDVFKAKIAAQDHRALIRYQELGAAARLAVPTPDHYYPLIYTLGLQDAGDDTVFFNDRMVGGSLNMTGVKIG